MLTFIIFLIGFQSKALAVDDINESGVSAGFLNLNPASNFMPDKNLPDSVDEPDSANFSAFFQKNCNVLAESRLKTTTIVTGTIIAGEATALSLGMHLFSGGDNPWVSSKNDLLLVLDLSS